MSRAGDLRGAATSLDDALKLDPQQIAVRREYAVTLAKLNQPEKARAQLALLKANADACGASCEKADELNAALARVQASLSAPPGTG